MISIWNLKEKTHFINEVISYLWKEWGTENNYIFVERIIKNITQSQTNDLPQVYIATKNNKLVGIITLLRNDLKSRQDLFPWLACLYVCEEYRGLHIGEALQKHVLQESKKMEYEKVYLITKLEGYYEKIGWNLMGYEPLVSGEMTKVYEIDITNIS